MTGPVEVIPVVALPEIEADVPLGSMIAAAAELADGDIVVVAQKVVSKVEGRLRSLADFVPSERARELSTKLDQDPRMVEAVLSESIEVIRSERVLIVETRHGLICANAGIDSSNLPGSGDEEVLLLPEDPDASAGRLRREIEAAAGCQVAIVISDSFGRPWRVGQTEVAIGCAGLDPVDDWRGRSDRNGRELAATVIATADQLTAAADLVREKDSGVPATVVRGLAHLVTEDDGPGAVALRRDRAEDLFR